MKIKIELTKINIQLIIIINFFYQLSYKMMYHQY